MAKIQPMNKNSSMDEDFQKPVTNPMMPAGFHLGKVVDIGYGSDKDKTRKKIYASLARLEKEVLLPRIIRANFDIWSPNSNVKGYSIDLLFGFTQALQMNLDDLDTDDPQLLHKLIEGGIWKDICFKVDRINLDSGFSFSAVKCFKKAQLNSVPANASDTNSQELPKESISYNPAAFLPAPPQHNSRQDDFEDDDIPF